MCERSPARTRLALSNLFRARPLARRPTGGAWGTYSAWGVGVERALGVAGAAHPARVFDRLGAHVDAFGVAPATGLAANAVPGGTATWSGSLLGVDLGQPMLPPVFGDAELAVNLSNLAGVARFGGLTTAVASRPALFRAAGLAYAIDVTGDAFADADGRPAHEEMAGTLDDRSAGVNLLAGFGAGRIRTGWCSWTRPGSRPTWRRCGAGRRRGID